MDPSAKESGIHLNVPATGCAGITVNSPLIEFLQALGLDMASELDRFVQTVLSCVAMDSAAVSGGDAWEKINAMKTAVQAARPELISPANAALTAEIASWISFAVKLVRKEVDASSLDTILSRKSFLAGNQATLADFAVFVAISGDDPSNSASVKRWLDTIQHLQASSSTLRARTNLARNPTIHYIKTSASPDAATAPAASAAQQPVPSTDKAAAAAPVDKGGKGKAKEEGKKDKSAAASSSSAPAKEASAAASAPVVEGGDADELDPSKLDIRVGKVVKCWNHPESDKLLCEEIDVGDEVNGKPVIRTIASGLQAFYKASEVEGRMVVVLANLKERTMAG
jgi:tRNA-binding EMAP/Myf-like protein